MVKTRTIAAVVGAVLVPFVLGCEEEKPAAPAPAATSAAVAATTTATASAPPPKPVKKPSHECPEGSEGAGTFDEPCMAKGTDRQMEIQWTKKMDDKGPSFRVVSKSKLEIKYGLIEVYFYDKDGKQLEVPEGGGQKARPKQKCAGYIFGGPMKPGEKAVITFSCVKKANVPEGTEHIEAEVQVVGFTGADGKRADTYWRNDDLVPDERPKGGIKADKKKK